MSLYLFPSLAPFTRFVSFLLKLQPQASHNQRALSLTSAPFKTGNVEMSQSFLFRSSTSQLRHSFASSICARSGSRPSRSFPFSLRGLSTKKRHPGPLKSPSPSNPSRKPGLGATSRASMAAPGGRRNFEDTFLNTTPTLLFELPKWTYYGPSAFALASFVGSVGAWFGYLGYMAKDLQDDWWLTFMNRLLSVTLSGAATWIFLTTRRRVRSITAVPINGTLYLRIVYPTTIPLPFRKPLVITVKPKDVTLQSRLADPRFISAADGQAASQESTTFKPNSMVSAVREKFSVSPGIAKQAWNIAFINTRRIWTGEQFLAFKVAGKNGTWKLDLLEGLFKDGGKPLDKLVSYDFAF